MVEFNKCHLSLLLLVAMIVSHDHLKLAHSQPPVGLLLTNKWRFTTVKKSDPRFGCWTHLWPLSILPPSPGPTLGLATHKACWEWLQRLLFAEMQVTLKKSVSCDAQIDAGSAWSQMIGWSFVLGWKLSLRLQITNWDFFDKVHLIPVFSVPHAQHDFCARLLKKN